MSALNSLGHCQPSVAASDGRERLYSAPCDNDDDDVEVGNSGRFDEAPTSQTPCSARRAATCPAAPARGPSDTSSRPGRFASVARTTLGAIRMSRAKALREHAAPGNAPGLDVKRRNYDHLHEAFNTKVKLTCADFCEKKAVVVDAINNEQLPVFLAEPRPTWSKVRWINVEGVSWDVISALALHFDLHPLAVEDIVHIPQRIKADFYEDFVYCSMALITLEESPGEDNIRVPLAKQLPHPTISPAALAAAAAEGRTDSGPVRAESGCLRQRHQFCQRISRTAGLASKRSDLTGTSDDIHVLAEQASLFLLRDGTVISIFQGAPADAPDTLISGWGPKDRGTRGCGGGASGRGPSGVRLHRSHYPMPVCEARTLVRDSEDGSFLLNLIIDSMVDHIMPVLDAYTTLLHDYEQVMLRKRPEAAVTRDLHVMQGDLNILKRTLLPSSTLMNTLRLKMDSSKVLRGVHHPAHSPPASSAPQAAPHADSAVHPSQGGSSASHLSHGGGSAQHLSSAAGDNGSAPCAGEAAASTPGQPPPGTSTGGAASAGTPNLRAVAAPLISSLARTYLSDVQDHVHAQLESMDSLAQQCKDLSDLIFNLNSHQSNSSMQTLAVVSTVFLPVTFMAGVYGTNFDHVPEYHWHYGYAYFWGLLLLITMFFVIILARVGMLNSS